MLGDTTVIPGAQCGDYDDDDDQGADGDGRPAVDHTGAHLTVRVATDGGDV